MLELGIACILSAVAWLYLLFFHGSFWRTGQRLPQARAVPGVAEAAHWPAVVAVVPARNEADMLPVTLPALTGQDYPGDFRVTLVDDGSTDGTGPLAAALAAGPADPITTGAAHRGLRPAPPGGLGGQGLGDGAGSAGRRSR